MISSLSFKRVCRRPMSWTSSGLDAPFPGFSPESFSLFQAGMQLTPVLQCLNREEGDVDMMGMMPCAWPGWPLSVHQRGNWGPGSASELAAELWVDDPQDPNSQSDMCHSWAVGPRNQRSVHIDATTFTGASRSREVWGKWPWLAHVPTASKDSRLC